MSWDDPSFIVPAPRGTATWAEVPGIPLELARSRAVQGRLFAKHILNTGILIHPKTGERIRIDDNFINRLMDNFERGTCDIVQVPVADEKNQHTETPVANIGEVVGLRKEGGKLFALIDARDPAAADKLGKTYLGASAFLSTDYTDTSTGRKAGPTLLHVAVTNRPYVTGLDDFREIVAASGMAADPVMLAYDLEEDHPAVGGWHRHAHQHPGGIAHAHLHQHFHDNRHEHLHEADDLAMTAAEGEGMYDTDELALAYALADGYDDASWDGDSGAVQLAGDSLDPQGVELTAAERGLAFTTGAAEDLGDGYVMDSGEITLAGEAERLSQQWAEMTARDRGNRFVQPRPVWRQLEEPRADLDMMLTRSDIDRAIEQVSEYSGIPEHGTSWARPGEGWQSSCHCSLSNAEMADHVCPSAPTPLGERALALSQVTRALVDPAAAAGQEAEALALSYRWGEGGEFGLAAVASETDTHDHYHTHDGVWGGDAGHGPVLDMRGGHRHPHRENAENDHAHPHEPGQDAGTDAEVHRLLGIAHDRGLEMATMIPLRVTNHGPRPGSGRTAHRGHLRRAGVGDDATDSRQPRRPNVPYPNVRGGIYDPGGLGSTEESARAFGVRLSAAGDGGAVADVMQRHPEFFR